MKILIAASEAVPYAKTGGLADVTGALLKEYGSMKIDARLVLPLYRGIEKNFSLMDTGANIKVPLGDGYQRGRILKAGNSAYFLKCDEFFDREDLYGTPYGDYPDNAERFIFFSRGILEACKAVKFRPDVIHCNDWQTGLVPLYLKTVYRTDRFFDKTSAVLTVHNLGYQGVFPISTMPLTGLDWALFTPEGMEFYGKVNFLKAGLVSADLITTVSINYAKEILTREYGFGLDGVLRKRASVLKGIINGIDYKEWDPAKDELIFKNYSIKNIAGKEECKRQLLKECALPSIDKPLACVVSRLSSQKGIDILVESIEGIISSNVNLIVFGKGDEIFHKKLTDAAKKYRGRAYIKLGFQNEFAHRIYAGSDIFLMPSRYEPCGLGQLIAMRYGTVPVARKTGGLADTVSDYDTLKEKGTGFLFSDYTPSAFLDCLKRAVCVYADKVKWKKLVANAMRTDFSWKSSAKKYIEYYRYAVKLKV